jgi:hypothetical protein
VVGERGINKLWGKLTRGETSNKVEKKPVPEYGENMVLDVLRDKDWTSALDIVDMVNNIYKVKIGLKDFYIFENRLIKSSMIEGKFGKYEDGNFVIDLNQDQQYSLPARRKYYRITQGGIRTFNQLNSPKVEVQRDFPGLSA